MLIIILEVQMKADLAKIREENEKITKEMERLKAQLAETLEKTQAVQKLIAEHKQESSRIRSLLSFSLCIFLIESSAY
jgi:hypothetical protein